VIAVFSEKRNLSENTMTVQYFFSPEHADHRDIYPVTIPGLPKTVYATREMAQQLSTLVAGKQPEAARTLVQWFGGMAYQN
jgi:hypothetical protein